MKDVITFSPAGTCGMTCEFRSPHGLKLQLCGTLDTIEPEAASDDAMTANPALIHRLA
jgi:hypothetical protein